MNGHRQHNPRYQATSSRPLHVDEALQFSPLSSIVPFGSDIVPLPAIERPTLPSFSSFHDRKDPQQSLQSLNREAHKTNGLSQRVQQTATDLGQYLEPEDLTELYDTVCSSLGQADLVRSSKFKVPPKVRSKDRRNVQDASWRTPKLGDFSNMILDRTDIAYQRSIRDPSKDKVRHVSKTKRARISQEKSPSKIHANGKNALVDPHATSNGISKSSSGLARDFATPNAQKHNEEAYIDNGKISVPHTKVGVSVEIPLASRTVERQQYETIPQHDSRTAQRQKYEPNSETEETLLKSADQRQQAEVAFQILHELIVSILEAEDNLQPDTSGVVSANASDFFVLDTIDQVEVPSLSPDMQIKLESAVRKVISLQTLDRVPAQQLIRIHKLCEGALKQAESLDLRIETGWSEGDVDEWMKRVGAVDCGLLAARTVLTIMSGGRKEKQIYSEELLQNILNVLKCVLDTCITSIVELRNSGATADVFRLVAARRKNISMLLSRSIKILRLLGDIISKEEISESAITTVEFLMIGLIFVENASSEKDSITGIGKFETLRRTAMDVLATLFTRYPDQRSFIFDEILTSIEKLPVTRQSARQYKLVEGKSIQLVSALIMRLIQTTASYTRHGRMKRDQYIHSSEEKGDAVMEDSDVSQDETSEDRMFQRANNKMTSPRPNMSSNPADQLSDLVQPLHEEARKTTHDVIHFLIQRALTSTKTGDQPYRNLLDIFTEDFINVLDLMEWPAAEHLLERLLANMISLVQSEKSPAPAKTMALDLMGSMGSAICRLTVSAKRMSQKLDPSASQMDSYLSNLCDEHFSVKLQEKELLVWNGPYLIALESLQSSTLDKTELNTAVGYLLTEWASKLSAVLSGKDLDNDPVIIDARDADLLARLNDIISGGNWSDLDCNFEEVTSSQGNLAYVMTILNKPFCLALARILRSLLVSMSSEHATVRSRSLKSLGQLLEEDPSILNRYEVFPHVLKCAMDSSPLVRDSALSLLGKSMTLTPALEKDVWKAIMFRTTDPAVGVRKRAMKLLKDFYLKTADRTIKTSIANALFQRVTDSEESVCDLAKQMFEEIWISPFCRSSQAPTESTVADDLALKEQVSLIVATVKRGEGVSAFLESLLRHVFEREERAKEPLVLVCRSMVNALFGGLIDQDDLPEKPEQQHILQTLAIFAKTSSELFSAKQLELLQPYINNLSSGDDLVVYRSVIVIYRCVLPDLSASQSGFLQTVQTSLLKSISKLAKQELNEVVACLWTIDGVLHNTERLARVTLSCLKNIFQSQNANLSADENSQMTSRVSRWIRITGIFSKYCDFEKHLRLFQEECSWWHGTSVSGSIVDIIAKFTSPKQPATIRAEALDSVCMICGSWPRHFLKEQVNSAFEIVFEGGTSELRNVVLQGFLDYFLQEERRSEKEAEISKDNEAERDIQTLGGSSATDHDGVTTSIAQRFLNHILEVALSTQDEYAKTAVDLITSICRQGLVHPKECGPALVALQTSENTSIASVALREYTILNQKYESIFEKDYMRAVQQAYTYQRNVVKSTLGVNPQRFTPKLRPLFEVIKSSNARLRKKFLANLCSRIDFDPTKIDVSKDPPEHLQFSRFLIENIAFFEYPRLDDLLHIVSCMEKLVIGTGTAVAHSIEAELLNVSTAPAPTDNTEPEQQVPLAAPVDDEKWRRLATCAIILSWLWDARTYLRRLYGLQSEQKQRDHKGKGGGKDLNRALTRIPGVTPEKFWESIPRRLECLGRSEDMMIQCQGFVELLSVDHDVKIAAEGEDVTAGVGFESSSEEGEGTPNPASGGGRGRKRRTSKAGSSTPVKRVRKKGRSGSRGRGRRASVDEDTDWA